MAYDCILDSCHFSLLPLLPLLHTSVVSHLVDCYVSCLLCCRCFLLLPGSWSIKAEGLSICLWGLTPAISLTLFSLLAYPSGHIALLLGQAFSCLGALTLILGLCWEHCMTNFLHLTLLVMSPLTTLLIIIGPCIPSMCHPSSFLLYFP